MLKIFSKKIAGIVLIFSLVFLMLFHLLVALTILPGDIVWGGTLSESDVITYEIVALCVTGLLLFIAIIRAGYIKNQLLIKTANILIWIMVAYFAFMIVGNMAAKTFTEKIIFIPLSIIMFISSFRLALKR